MTISQAITVAAATTMLLSVLAPAQDQEKKVKRSDLPPAVEKAVVEQSQGATIRRSRYPSGRGFAALWKPTFDQLTKFGSSWSSNTDPAVIRDGSTT